MNFIHIEGGYFNMGGGSGKSVYTAEVDDFYLGDMLFTQRDWLRATSLSTFFQKVE